MSDPVFIDDGYTRKATIKAEPGIHGSLGIEFRPALADERWQFVRDNDRAFDGADYKKRAVAFAVKHLQTWNASRDDKPVPLAPEMVAKLHPVLLNKIINLICYLEPAEQEANEKNS